MKSPHEMFSHHVILLPTALRENILLQGALLPLKSYKKIFANVDIKVCCKLSL